MAHREAERLIFAKVYPALVAKAQRKERTGPRSTRSSTG